MIMYKTITIKGMLGDEQNHIIRDNGNGSFTSFPAQEDNPEYQTYLKWLAEGNTPTPADGE
jgi:hypothetical protein